MRFFMTVDSYPGSGVALLKFCAWTRHAAGVASFLGGELSMGTQQQENGDKKPSDAGGTGVSNSHAAGSGSTTGDPGNVRGPQTAGKSSQASGQGTSGSSPDDHIELGTHGPHTGG